MTKNSDYQLTIADVQYTFSNGGHQSIGYVNMTMVDFRTSAVPEPTPFAVVGMGALGLFLRRRSRK